MDLTMPKDYLPELLSNMQTQLSRIETKTDDQSKSIGTIELQTQSMYKDIDQAQKDIKRLERVRGKKINLAPRTLYLLAVASVIVLVIVASVLGINVSALLR